MNIHLLNVDEIELFVELMTMFGKEFDEIEVYTGARPGDDYVKDLLASKSFFALAAVDGEQVIGGLAAYELCKFEQERSEVYIYDLAVAETHRRQGVATALIQRTQEIAGERGAWTVFVQADQGDAPAIELYSKLGRREDVLHFDIPVVNAEQSASVQELLALVTHMVEDNDLSIQEFATLDRWLSDNRHIAHLWPANIIGEGVHLICADNVVDQQELDALCGAMKAIASRAADS